MEKRFNPITPQLGIPGTNYRMQLGLISGLWAVCLIKSLDIVDTRIFTGEDLTEIGYPKIERIVDWILRDWKLSKINPRQVHETSKALVTRLRVEIKKVSEFLEQIRKQKDLGERIHPFMSDFLPCQENKETYEQAAMRYMMVASRKMDNFHERTKKENELRSKKKFEQAGVQYLKTVKRMNPETMKDCSLENIKDFFSMKIDIPKELLDDNPSEDD